MCGEKLSFIFPSQKKSDDDARSSSSSSCTQRFQWEETTKSLLSSLFSTTTKRRFFCAASFFACASSGGSADRYAPRSSTGSSSFTAAMSQRIRSARSSLARSGSPRVSRTRFSTCASEPLFTGREVAAADVYVFVRESLTRAITHAY